MLPKRWRNNQWDIVRSVGHQAIKNAFWLQIMTSNEQIEYKKLGIAAQMDADYLLNHYGKVKTAAKQPLTPDWHQHYPAHRAASAEATHGCRHWPGAKTVRLV